MSSKAPSDARAKTPALPAPLILLVEDEAPIREVIEAVLEAEGYRVVSSGDGSDALAVLRSGLRPCMIILDLMMPVMDGWQFRLAQLRDAELLKIPTVVYTAIGNVREVVEELNVAGGFEKGDFVEMLRFVGQFCPSRA
ncbi:response regulator [Candidatus Binatia bacterium]|jgi:CheY-like chemotaxis protein|nr:response regulator [Candidatus Binatia bacterium]